MAENSLEANGNQGDGKAGNEEIEALRKINEDIGDMPVQLKMGGSGEINLSVQKSGEESNFDYSILSNPASRMGYVAAKGTAGVPLQALHAFGDDLQHKEQLIAKAGGGLAFGAAMRTALAKSGTGRAIVGSVLGFYMVKDAMVPVYEGMKQGYNAENRAELEQGVNTFSGGLGHFAYDSALTIGFANLGEKGAERILRKTMGNRTFSRFESYKEHMWTSDSHPLGNTINGSARLLGSARDYVTGRKPVAETANQRPALTDIQREQMTGEGLSRYQELVDVNQTYSRGLPLRNGERAGLTETLFVLERGKDPRQLTPKEFEAFIGSEKVVPVATTLSVVPKGLERGVEVPKVRTAVSDAKPGVTGDGKASLKGAEKIDPKLAEKVSRETNPENMTEMSKNLTREMAKMDEEAVVVADRKEADLGPVYSALKTDHKPLDPGYGVVGQQMFLLAEQVQRAEQYQQVGTLFGYLRDATNQYNLGNATESAKLAQQLNLMSREIHTGLKQGLRKIGLKPDEVLAAKNPPLFAVRNDGQAGPHTIPEINKVWDVDVVIWPRNMMQYRSSLTSGINGHEVGHNQYGGLTRLEESIRDTVIGNAVKNGLESKSGKKGESTAKPEGKADNPVIQDLRSETVIRTAVSKSLAENGKASELVEVPGHGKVTKQELYEDILKAQANENTSDMWGTAWYGPNSGLALGVLLQSLRTGGKLESRNVMGERFKIEGTRFGFEVHGIDRFRLKLDAEVLRQRSNGDPLVLEYAKALDRYAEASSRKGDYVWNSVDHPGQSVTVPKAEFEALIPHLVGVQLNHPLPALKGNKFGDILPDLPTQVRKMNEIADIMVDGIKSGREPSMIPFDVKNYTIGQVFGSGMHAELRLISQGMSAKDANILVNKYSDHFRSQYLAKGDPHVEPIGKSFNSDGLKLNPSGHSAIPATNPGRIDRMGSWLGNQADKQAINISGYAGGNLSQYLFTEPVKPSYLDISVHSVLEDAEKYKKIAKEGE